MENKFEEIKESFEQGAEKFKADVAETKESIDEVRAEKKAERAEKKAEKKAERKQNRQYMGEFVKDFVEGSVDELEEAVDIITGHDHK